MNHHITFSITGFYLPLLISVIFIVFAIARHEMRRPHVALMALCPLVTLAVHWFLPGLYLQGEGMILALFPAYLLLQGIGALLILLNQEYNFSCIKCTENMKNALFNPYVVFPIQFISLVIPDLLINLFNIKLPEGIESAIIGGAGFDDTLILTPMISLSVAVILTDILGKKVGPITYAVYALLIVVILL